MKRLKTLALAGIVAISACTTTHNALDGSEQSPSQPLYQLEAGTDSLYARISSANYHTRMLPKKESLTTAVETDVADAFVRRYYGLDALSRSMYLTEDLLESNQTIKDLRAQLRTCSRDELTPRERDAYNEQVTRLEQRIDGLNKEVNYWRASFWQEREEKLEAATDTVYLPQYIQRTPVTRETVHPVEKDVPFIRLGDEYYQFPFARIVCPGLDAPVKACIDIEDVRRDYQQHIREQGAESLREQ